MVEAFDERKADFSGMAHIENPIWIDKDFHKAFVEVNERGSEAAAATTVIEKMTDGHIGERVIFTADHPFLFLIRDDRTGCILYLGRLVAPKG